MTKTTAFLFATSLLFTVACDSEDAVTERSAEIEAPAEASDAPCPDDHGKHGDKAQFVAEKLCSELDCTEEQATKISELFASQREGRDHADREAHRAQREAADKALATAFRAETFDPAVLEQHRPERDMSEREDHMIAVATELHAILTPTQRATFADKIAERGPMFFGGHGGRGRHHGGKGPHHDGAGDVERGDAHHGDRLAKHVEQLCAQVSCTAEQQTELTQTLESARDAHREAPRAKPDFSGVANVFRADTLDVAALRAALEASKPDHEGERGQELGAVVTAVHDILTPEQRAIVADMIEGDGLRALTHGKREGKRDRR